MKILISKDLDSLKGPYSYKICDSLTLIKFVFN